MTPLRAQMIKAMQMHGFSPRTPESYLAAVTALTHYYRCAPDTLSVAQLAAYIEYLVNERKLAPASCRVALNGIRFLFVKVLKWPQFEMGIVLPKCPRRIPALLTRVEVERIIAACGNPTFRMMLTVG